MNETLTGTLYVGHDSWDAPVVVGTMTGSQAREHILRADADFEVWYDAGDWDTTPPYPEGGNFWIVLPDGSQWLFTDQWERMGD